LPWGIGREAMLTLAFAVMAVLFAWHLFEGQVTSAVDSPTVLNLNQPAPDEKEKAR
jgi:hypothetical protein